MCGRTGADVGHIIQRSRIAERAGLQHSGLQDADNRGRSVRPIQDVCKPVLDPRGIVIRVGCILRYFSQAREPAVQNMVHAKRASAPALTREQHRAGVNQRCGNMLAVPTDWASATARNRCEPSPDRPCQLNVHVINGCATTTDCTLDPVPARLRTDMEYHPPAGVVGTTLQRPPVDQACEIFKNCHDGNGRIRAAGSSSGELHHISDTQSIQICPVPEIRVQCTQR